MKQTKNIKKQPKKMSKSDVFYIILGIVSCPFLVVSFILRTLYNVLIKVPNTQSIGLGLFRTAVMFYLSCVLLYQYKYELKEFLTSSTFMTDEFAKNAIIFVGALVAVNLIVSFMVMTGLNTGISYDSDNQMSSGYENIDKALSFRNGIASMQSTRGSVSEYAKTSFVDHNTFSSYRKNPNMKKSISFMDGMLGMQSTTGKYEMLKNMFGGK